MINTVFSIYILLVLVLTAVSGHIQYGLIYNSTQQVTTSTLPIQQSNAVKLYKYAQTVNKKTITFKEMIDLSGIPREELEIAVLSMVHPKIKVLRTKY